MKDMKTQASDIGLSMLVDLDPEADSIIVWENGHTMSRAISKPGGIGAKMAGNYLALINVGKEDGCKPIDDGFSALMTKATWTKLVDAVDKGQPFDMPGQGGMLPLSLVWDQ